MPSQELRDAMFVGSDQRSNFKQIIAKRSDLVQFARGRMVTPGADTTYEAGTILGQVTATGLLKPWNAASVDGSEVPVGALSESALVSAVSGDGGEVVYIRKGTLFYDKLIAPTNAWVATYGAKQFVEGGENLVEL
jgi:hypothetical protein